MMPSCVAVKSTGPINVHVLLLPIGIADNCITRLELIVLLSAAMWNAAALLAAQCTAISEFHTICRLAGPPRIVELDKAIVANISNLAVQELLVIRRELAPRANHNFSMEEKIHTTKRKPLEKDEVI